MEPLTPGRVTSRAGSPSLSHRAFPPFCPQPPHGAPSSLLCSPQLCQRDGLPVPFQIPAFLMPLGVRQVWASHTPSRLAAPCSRNGFVILRTGGSPSVALHPALRQRSYFRFRVGGAYPEGTCTPLTLRLGGALGAGHAREKYCPIRGTNPARSGLAGTELTTPRTSSWARRAYDRSPAPAWARSPGRPATIKRRISRAWPAPTEKSSVFGIFAELRRIALASVAPDIPLQIDDNAIKKTACTRNDCSPNASSVWPRPRVCRLMPMQSV